MPYENQLIGKRMQWLCAMPAIAALALLAGPASGWAQSSADFSLAQNGTVRREAPACVYKGVMSDAEIERCTGHPVHFDYRILRSAGPSASRTSPPPADSG